MNDNRNTRQNAPSDAQLAALVREAALRLKNLQNEQQRRAKAKGAICP